MKEKSPFCQITDNEVIFMFWKKKDLMQEYLEFQNDKLKEVNRKSFAQIYGNLKVDYQGELEKCSNDKEFIDSEKTRLEIKLGRHEGSYAKEFFSLFMGMILALFTVYITENNTFGGNFNSIIKAIVFLILLFILSIIILPDIKRHSHQDRITFIALKVLYDLEKEMELKGSIDFKEEVVVTKDEENTTKEKEQDKKCKNKLVNITLNTKNIIYNKDNKCEISSGGLETLMKLCKAYKRIKNKHK